MELILLQLTWFITTFLFVCIIAIIIKLKKINK